jgi:CubicO group peptidase (beta-lactamase class C family)
MSNRRSPGALAALTLFVFLLASGLAAVAEAGRLDRFLERKMKKARVPGMAVALVVDGEVAWTEGYGWADVENEKPATPDTLFLIASISKLFTATAIMQLHEQEGLDLDRDVSDYLPFQIRNPAFPDQPITARHLLTHTSSISDEGLRGIVVNTVSFGDWTGSLKFILRDYLTPAGDIYNPVACFHDGAPGTRFEYSNVGYGLLGLMVEHVSDRSFERYQQKAILGPLEMNESSWFLRNLDAEHIAVPYTWDSGAYSPYPHLGMAFYPAGQLRTSARQLANFARLHLADGRLQGRRLLVPETVHEMMRVQFPDAAPNRGLGFGLIELGGARYATHSGGFYGCATDFWLELEDQLGVIILTNGEPFTTERARAMIKILNRLFKYARKLDRAD